MFGHGHALHFKEVGKFLIHEGGNLYPVLSITPKLEGFRVETEYSVRSDCMHHQITKMFHKAYSMPRIRRRPIFRVRQTNNNAWFFGKDRCIKWRIAERIVASETNIDNV